MSIHICTTFIPNYFIANKKSKRLSFYDVSNRIVIAYLMNILQSNEDAPNGLVTVIKNNRKLQKFLMFILEYIVANFPKERYEILYRVRILYNFDFDSVFYWHTWETSKTDKWINDLLQSEKFKYGIHSHLLSDD